MIETQKRAREFWIFWYEGGNSELHKRSFPNRRDANAFRRQMMQRENTAVIPANSNAHIEAVKAESRARCAARGDEAAQEKALAV